MPSQLALPILAPGFRGLNTELADTVGLIDPLWATGFTDWVWDDSGKISSRKGYTRTSDDPSFGDADVERLFEYIDDAGVKRLIGVTSGNLWVSTDDGASWSDVTGSLSFTTTDWKFVNFNNKVIGAAPGHTLVFYEGTGNFADITASSGTVPVSDGRILAAAGRLWAGNDASDVVSYCDLLDETDWDSGTAGSLDLTNVWSRDSSRLQAIAVIGSTLVFFAQQEIVMYADGSGSELGINPANLYVTDTIEGTGCISRDAVVSIGEGDLWFLSKEGVQSLSRLLQDRTNPLIAVTRNTQSLVQSLIDFETDIEFSVKAVFVPEENFVLFLFPDSDKALMLDTRFKLDDGSYRAAEWRSQTHNTFLLREDGTLLIGRDEGYVGTYTGYRDDGSTAITPTITSPWLNGGEQLHNRIKILNEAAFVLYGIDTISCTLRWGFDFRPLEFSQAFTSEYTSSGSEWGTGEFSEAEFGDGLRHRREYVPMSNDGQYVRMYLSVTSTDTDAKVSLQTLTIFAKPGAQV